MYTMATLLEGVVTEGRLIYEVKQVYIHIPAEQSAARFELKIAGVVRIITKVCGLYQYVAHYIVYRYIYIYIIIIVPQCVRAGLHSTINQRTHDS